MNSTVDIISAGYACNQVGWLTSRLTIRMSVVTVFFPHHGSTIFTPLDYIEVTQPHPPKTTVSHHAACCCRRRHANTTSNVH
jgi:hypothetical protein